MAVFTGTAISGAINPAAHTLIVTLFGSWGPPAPNGSVFVRLSFEWGIGALTDSGAVAFDGCVGELHDTFEGNGTFSYSPGTIVSGFITQPALLCDRTYLFRANRDDFGGAPCDAHRGRQNGGVVGFKTNALDPFTFTPLSDSVSQNSANITCRYFANTDESFATVKMQYKRSVDPTWLDAPGGSDVTGGYTELIIGRSLSGLLGGTQYDFKLVATRNTNNVTSFESAVAQFTTTASDPIVVTNPASPVGTTTATLQGSINPNNQTVFGFFQWGLTIGYGNTTPEQGPGGGAVPIPFSEALTGLSPTVTYHFRAVARVGAAFFFGGDNVFTTGVPPGTQDRPMPNTIQYSAKPAVAATFQFLVETPVSTGSDRFLSTPVPWVAGDVKVYQDSGGGADVGTLPVRVGTSQVYAVSLTAAELTAQNRVMVVLRDQDGPAWRDCVLIISLRLSSGQFDIDSTGFGGNVSALSAVGAGTGYGLFARGGAAGIRADAVGASGQGIEAQGIGTGNGINALPGASGRHVNFWDTLEGAEPTAAPANNVSYGRILQYLKRRETNRVTQTSSVQTWYRDDSVTPLATRPVSDDLVTQVQGKLV